MHYRSLRSSPVPESDLGREETGKEDLKKKLTRLQYEVTRQNTEPPFNNEYWDNWRGDHVDVVSGEPLFSSLDKLTPAVLAQLPTVAGSY